MADSVGARAPSSTANLGPGFDVFGLALDAFFDEVVLSRTKGGITIKTSGEIPVDPLKNTAGIVVKKMSENFKTGGGLEIRIKKGVPTGFGMGSSAASAAAAAVAFDGLFGLGLDSNELVRFAGMGEKASAGAVHYDNVAASVLGGFVIVRDDPLDVIGISPPRDLALCVAIPSIKTPARKTEISRGVIPKKVGLECCVKNISSAASMVAGFAKKDTLLIGSSVRDAIVEPARLRMIPGFSRIKSGALDAGALGVTISGAGPSVIAFASKSSDLKKIAGSMEEGFGSAGTKCRTVVCRPSRGASVIGGIP